MNPLLDAIPENRSFGEYYDWLRYDPLDNIDTSTLGEIEKYDYLVDQAMPFEPTAQSLRIAATIIGMIRSSYRERNPCTAESKRRHVGLLHMMQKKLKEVPSSLYGQALTLVIKGITGTGKTVLVNLLLENLQQVIEHSKNKSAGWEKSIQITYLKVPMSHDGTRGGFLMNVIMAIDELLNTNYVKEIARTRLTIEQKLVQVISLLHSLYVGVLVIEEIQEENMVTSPQAPLMQKFLLSLLNSGIPIVFVGNPAGFDWIEGFSQGLRRLNVVPAEYIHPCDKGSSDWDSVVLGIKQYYVLDVDLPDEKKLSEKLFLYSGGIPDLALMLWRRAQRLILLNEMPDGQTDDLLVALNAAYLSTDYDDLRPMAKGFSTKKYNMLRGFKDIPWQYYKNKWGDTDDEDQMGNSQTTVEDEKAAKRKPRNNRKCSDKSKFKAQQTRARNRLEKNQLLAETLDPEDLRNAGVKSELLSGLYKTMKELDEKFSVS